MIDKIVVAQLLMRLHPWRLRNTISLKRRGMQSPPNLRQKNDMATQRLVNTNFWKDTYIIDLDPTQKLLFLYFLTSPRTSLAGVYEISLREAAFDTGIDRDMVE